MDPLWTETCVSALWTSLPSGWSCNSRFDLVGDNFPLRRQMLGLTTSQQITVITIIIPRATWERLLLVPKQAVYRLPPLTHRREVWNISRLHFFSGEATWFIGMGEWKMEVITTGRLGWGEIRVGRLPRAILDVPSCLLHWCIRNTRNILQFRVSNDKENVVFFLNKKSPIIVLLCYVWSVALYGAETWTLRATDQKRLGSFEMWWWRRSVGPIMWEMKKCYLESMSRGISYMK